MIGKNLQAKSEILKQRIHIIICTIKKMLSYIQVIQHKNRERFV